MNMITSTLLAAGFSLLAGSAAAQTCVANNCAALGFTKSAGNCEGDIIRCPFDTSKVFCKEKIACSLPVCKDKVTAKPGNSTYITSVCTDCSGSQVIKTGWKCDTGYHECDNNCIPLSQCCTGSDCDTGCCSNGRCVNCPTCYNVIDSCSMNNDGLYEYTVDICIAKDSGSECGSGGSITEAFNDYYSCDWALGNQSPHCTN